MPFNLTQLVVNTLILGSLYALLAVGLTLSYRILKFANFAHAELITFGAYIAYSLNRAGVDFYTSLPIAFIASGALAIALDMAVYKPLRDKNADPIALMISSIGVGLVIRHLLQEIYSAQIKSFRLGFKAFDVLGARITLLQLSAIILAVVMIIGFHLLFTRTKLGKAMRATSDNPNLAMASGIPTDNIIRGMWFLGGGAAGLGGALRAADTRLIPTLGFEILLPVFAVVLLGGIGSFYGAIVAAYLLALAENLSVVLLTALGLNTSYRAGVAFLVLLLVLIFKPQGIMGMRIGGERE